jgi:hypothetical protein
MQQSYPSPQFSRSKAATPTEAFAALAAHR